MKKVTEQELMSVFKVQELEERLEMAKWSASLKGGTNSTGPYIEGGVTVTF